MWGLEKGEIEGRSVEKQEKEDKESERSAAEQPMESEKHKSGRESWEKERKSFEWDRGGGTFI